MSMLRNPNGVTQFIQDLRDYKNGICQNCIPDNQFVALWQRNYDGIWDALESKVQISYNVNVQTKIITLISIHDILLFVLT